MTKTLVILNPISGNGNGARVWHAIEAALRENGIAFDLARTQAPRHATQIAEQAKRDGYETLVAVGGDGIVHEIVNGLMRATNGAPAGTLAVIPVGSGNDFAKMIPLARGDWQAAVQKIAAGNTRWFDVGQVTGDHSASGAEPEAHYFANGLDTGFGALVSKHAHVQFLTGTLMYLVAIFKTLINYYVPRLRIELADHTVIEQPSTITAVFIGRCFGSGFWIAPTAEVDDGLFDIYVAEGLGRIGILSLLPRVMKGTHVGDPRIKSMRSSRVLITSPDPLAVEADGELPYLDAHRLEIQILPKRLRVIV
jgi:YegS/Rv2252/BmrU family lipid kinase